MSYKQKQKLFDSKIKKVSYKALWCCLVCCSYVLLFKQLCRFALWKDSRLARTRFGRADSKNFSASTCLPVCTADDPRYTDMDTSNGHNAGRLLPAGLLSILVPYLYPNGLRILDITRLFVPVCVTTLLCGHLE